MSIHDPFALRVPAGTRPVGAGPHWAPGERVRWHFRRHDFAAHGTEVVQPTRVVRDDERGALLWLAGETPTAESRIAGFEKVNPHDVPDADRFLPPGREPARVQLPGRWHGRGVLRIVPAGLPFSVWVFRAPGGEHAAWYINLEQLHVRAGADLYTADHILDIVIHPGEEPRLKDEDELAGALAGGMYDPEAVRTIRAHADLALAQYAAGHWAFDEEWTHWAPPPEWAMTPAEQREAAALLRPWLGADD